MVKQFFSQEASLAFIIPFSFTTDKKKDRNVCMELFGNIKPNDKPEQYEFLKSSLVSILKKKFPYATTYFHGTIAQNNNVFRNCCFRNYQPYKGRNLCHCFSICRKFHDDSSENIPRLDICLGTYLVHYELPDSGKIFEFYIDAFLLLSDAPSGRGGFLIFNISLASVRKSNIDALEENTLDSFIFIKHLFYKNRLECSITDSDGKNKNVRGYKTSISKWADEYFGELMSVLGLKKEEKVDFLYSIMEINNVTDSSGKQISLVSRNEFLLKYRSQIYGLMVSDEGWRYVSDDELERTFSNNYWSSRNFSLAFFLNHNALIINQYNDLPKESDIKQQNYSDFSKKWFSFYAHSPECDFYTKYAQLRPCIPGVSSLILNAFLNAIYKDMVLKNVKVMSENKLFSDEEKYKELAFTLQQHSMSLDAIKNIEDCIYSQFGIPAELEGLHGSYQREANNVQNQKVMDLTFVTIVISICAMIVSVLAIGGEGNQSLFASGMDWTVAVLVFVLALSLLSFFYAQVNLKKKLKYFWNKMKRK